MFPQIVWNCLAGTAWLPIVFLAISNASAAAGGAATTDPGVVVIKEAHLAVTLPPRWSTTPERARKKGRLMLSFRREPLDDKNGRRIIPRLGLVVEPVDPDQDVAAYSIAKRSTLPFKVLETYDSEDGKFGEAGGIGYLAFYADDGGVTHKIYVLHAIVGDSGIQLTLDGTA